MPPVREEKVSKEQIVDVASELKYIKECMDKGALSTMLRAAFWDATMGDSSTELMQTFIENSTPTLRRNFEAELQDTPPAERSALKAFLFGHDETYQAVVAFEDGGQKTLAKKHVKILGQELLSVDPDQVLEMLKPKTIEKILPELSEEDSGVLSKKIALHKKRDPLQNLSEHIAHACQDPLQKQAYLLSILSENHQPDTPKPKVLQQLAVTKYVVDDLADNIPRLLGQKSVSENIHKALDAIDGLQQTLSGMIGVMQAQLCVSTDSINASVKEWMEAPGYEHIHRLPDNFSL